MSTSGKPDQFGPHPAGSEFVEAADAPLASSSVEELVLIARDGCAAAFAELFCRYRPRLIRFLQRRFRNNLIEAEEVVQDTFTKAWTSLDRYDPRYQFTTWLYTIAFRTAVDACQKRRQLTTVRMVDKADRSATPHVDLETREQVANIWAQAQQLLTEDQYAVLWLRYGEELSIREIASVLRKTAVGVRVLLHRARVELQSALQE